MRERFWERYSLTELSDSEWEALCDGCGQCCLLKLEDEDSGEIVTLDLACRLLDIRQCRCSDYPNRFARVPGCTKLSLDNLPAFRWLPETCAYRRLHEGRGLADWHPLVSGDSGSVQRAGVGVARFAIPEESVPDEELEDHIIAVLPIGD